jgi:anti-sigma B factor antagonist
VLKEKTMDLTITIDEQPDHVVCRPEGELEAHNVDEMRRALSGVVGARVVILDLTDITFIDSAGLGCLIGAIRRVREADGEVAVASPRPTLTRLLRTTGFDRIVPVEETVDAALSAATERRIPG